MTRIEVERLKRIETHLIHGWNSAAQVEVIDMIQKAEREFAAEDAHHDSACRPVNLGEAA